MDTVERTPIDQETVTYDGFISYSHAADGLLAPRLQAGLQRFAKPWWKRRAVRIFRDESSLSANPHLWSSITEALDTSGWFVLLLSPDAAQSEWVNQEIDYWKTHRDPSRILPVVTDGKFGWAGGDVKGDAVPEQLQGVFSEEPRWVDVRWAKDEDQLDLQDPRFADAVADIASSIRGIPKDDLASEEVRQHRRTVRTAWSGGALVAVLAVAALFFAFNSAANERLARSRELSGAAEAVVEDDPELATRLVVHAASLVDEDEQPPAVIDALWKAGVSNKLVDVLDLGATLYTSIALTQNGSLLVAAQDNFSLPFPDLVDTGRLTVLDAKTLETAWEWRPETDEGAHNPSISPNGRLVAVAVRAAPDADLASTGIEVFDLRSGDPVATLSYPGCATPGAPAFSPDGTVLALTTADVLCPREESQTGRWVELLDTDTWESIRVDELPATNMGSYPQWTDDGQLYVFGSHEVYRYTESFKSLEPLGVAGFGDVSPDGSLLATFNLQYGPGQTGLAVFDAETLERIDLLPWDGFPRFPAGIAFTDDGESLFVGAEGASTILYDLGSGTPALKLPTPETDGVLRDDHTGRIYTSHPDGTIRVWNAISAAYGLELLEDLGAASWVNGNNSFSAGDGVTAVYHIDIDRGRPYVSFFDQQSGEFLADPIEAYFPASPTRDGRFVLGLEPTVLVSVDPYTGDTRTLHETEDDLWLSVSFDGSQVAVGGWEENETGQEIPQWRVTLDLDGNIIDRPGLSVEPRGFDDETILAGDPTTSETFARHRATGEELWRDRFNFFTMQVTDHGQEGIGKTEFAVIDIETGDKSLSIPIEVDRPRGFELSPSRALLAVGDQAQLRIINAETGIELRSIQIPGVSDIHWIDEETIVIGSRNGVWGRMSLDTGELLDDARQSIRSGFSDSECQIYALDPCPTLEELRGG